MVIFGRHVAERYAIKRSFVIPPLLTSVSALPVPGETLTPIIPCLEQDTALACYIFDNHEPILIIFGGLAMEFELS